MGYSTTDLLSSIKRRCLMPVSQITFQDTDLLAFADEELQLQIVPRLMSTRQDYFVVNTTTAIVQGQSAYAIPTRAIGNKLKSVTYVDTQNNLYPLSRIRPEEIPYIQGSPQAGNPTAFYLQGTDVCVFPTPSAASGSLQLSYYRKLNNLVSIGSVGTIVGINTTTFVASINSVPSTFSVGVLCDLVKANPGFNSLATDQAIAAINSTNITFASLPSGLAVGDYVCLAGQAPTAQLPLELHYILAQRVAVKVLEAIGDQNNISTAQAKLQEMEDNAATLFADRVEAAATKIVSPYSLSDSIGTRF